MTGYCQYKLFELFELLVIGTSYAKSRIKRSSLAFLVSRLSKNQAIYWQFTLEKQH